LIVLSKIETDFEELKTMVGKY